MEGCWNSHSPCAEIQYHVLECYPSQDPLPWLKCHHVPWECPSGKFKPRPASFQLTCWGNPSGNPSGKQRPKELCALAAPTAAFPWCSRAGVLPFSLESTSRSPCPGAGDTCAEGTAWMLHLGRESPDRHLNAMNNSHFIQDCKIFQIF